MPTARFGLAAAVQGGRLCVVGGYDANYLPLATLEIY
jgi:hypothetical protein